MSVSEPDVRPDRLLTVTEVADRLQLHPQTIRRLIKSGHLPHVDLSIGARHFVRRRVTEEQLAAFIAERTVE